MASAIRSLVNRVESTRAVVSRGRGASKPSIRSSLCHLPAGLCWPVPVR